MKLIGNIKELVIKLTKHFNYDEDTIMENSLLNIILSDYSPVWWVIVLFMLFIVRFSFKYLLRNTIINIIVSLIVRKK